jgi:endo-1,4-beta-xylanase
VVSPRRLLLALLGLLFAQQSVAVAAPEVLLLWPDGAPGAVADGGNETVRVTEQGEHIVSNVHRPSLTVYLPTKKVATGTAVVVVPGGGHRELWTDHEGHNVARFLNERGIAAFVLKYRLARAPDSHYTIEGDALGDLKRALRLVRARSAGWSIDAHRVGVIGFSAGGQLAALAATRFDAGVADASDPLERQNSRPDFAALVYPGTWPDLVLSAQTPPLFLLCGSDDRPEVVAGVTKIFLSARELKIPAELHIYSHVGHGFGLRATNDGPVARWPIQWVEWLGAEQLLKVRSSRQAEARD